MLLSKLIFDILLYVFLFRLWLQHYHAPYNNQVSQLIIRCTAPIVRPLQKIVPGWRGFDLAIVLSYLIIAILKYLFVLGFAIGHFPNLIAVVCMAVIDFFEKNIEFFFFLVFIRAILSWFAPSASAPATQILIVVTEPIMSKVRKLIPPVGALDISVIVLLVALRLLDYFVIGFMVKIVATLVT